MKHEWKKEEKVLYLPKTKPVLVDVPKMNYFVIEGKGNPNSPEFSTFIETLYAVSYAVRMSYKSDEFPEGYFEYTVYPLEGIWDLSDEGRKTYEAGLDKDELVYQIMIRQPDFVTPEFTETMKHKVKMKKPNLPIELVEFKTFEEGKSIQMLHLGSYDSEPETFKIMEEYMTEMKLKRTTKMHKEIYLTDARKVLPDKQKTVLRIWVK
ncbi:MAG: GyrI-like domain-containing protein [Clostridia bacterium]|nr:GyrI-like domain-containing protein [Clostridia bacterium]